MKVCIFFIAVLVLATLVYSDEITAGLNNPELVAKTVDCLEEKSPCTKFGAKAKLVLKQISRTGICHSCSDQEQNKAYEVIKRFRKQNPTIYSRLLARYRPSGVPKDVPAPLKELAGDHPSKPIKA